MSPYAIHRTWVRRASFLLSGTQVIARLASVLRLDKFAVSYFLTFTTALRTVSPLAPILGLAVYGAMPLVAWFLLGGRCCLWVTLFTTVLRRSQRARPCGRPASACFGAAPGGPFADLAVDWTWFSVASFFCLRVQAHAFRSPVFCRHLLTLPLLRATCSPARLRASAPPSPRLPFAIYRAWLDVASLVLRSVALAWLTPMQLQHFVTFPLL